MVDLGIGRIDKLLEQHIAIGGRGGDLLGPVDGTGHAEAPFGEFEFGPVGGEQFAPLQAHGLRHGQGERDPFRGGHKSQGDARVAASGLDQFLARSQQTVLFGLGDHGGADAALHRIGRIAPLDLGQYPGASRGDNPVELH